MFPYLLPCSLSELLPSFLVRCYCCLYYCCTVATASPTVQRSACKLRGRTDMHTIFSPPTYERMMSDSALQRRDWNPPDETGPRLAIWCSYPVRFRGCKQLLLSTLIAWVPPAGLSQQGTGRNHCISARCLLYVIFPGQIQLARILPNRSVSLPAHDGCRSTYWSRKHDPYPFCPHKEE